MPERSINRRPFLKINLRKLVRIVSVAGKIVNP